VELITIDAVVLDAEGHPVRGLTREDFVVTEEGRPREIESFEAISLEPEPELVEPMETASSAARPVVVTNTITDRGSGRAFAVIVDDLGISRQETPAVRDAVQEFVDDALVAGDEVTLGTTSGSAWWSARMPDGREDLLKVLARVEGSYVDTTQTDYMTEYEAFWINNYEVGGQAPLGSAEMVAPGSVRERVIRRWMDRELCGALEVRGVGNCWPLVKSTAAAIDGARRQRDRLMLSAIRRAFDALAPVHGRTSLLLFSPGFVQDNDLPLGRVRAASRETNTAVYFIDARGLVTDGGVGWANVAEPFGDPREEHRMRFEQTTLSSAGAQDLADDTGGFSVRNTNDLAGGAQRIADESRVFYLLGFRASVEETSDEWRKLEVEVRNPDLTVRARRGYTLRSFADDVQARPGRTKEDEDAPEPTPSVGAALDSVHTLPGLPLRAMVYILEPRADGATHVLVTAELDTRQLAFRRVGSQRVADLELGVTATHRDTGRGFLHSDDITMAVEDEEGLGWRGLVREFELTTGVHQARVVVRDRSTGEMGAVTQRFEVPFPGELRLSTPILTDRLVPANGPQSRPQPALSAHRSFLSSGGLYCQFEVFGTTRDRRSGLPKVVAGLEIRTRGGRLIRRVDPTPIDPDADGRLVRLVGMGLSDLAEGPYDFIISVQDQVADERIEDREPFRVVGALP
jgi:VWFA-related protein